jgi:hypothetical protein
MCTPRLLLQSLIAGVIAAGAGAAFAQSPPPEGKVQINYNRCDSKYDDWGAHVWKSPSIPLFDVEWQHPLPPTGKNDFGVYWQFDLKAFGSTGKVNYIIHKGDIKDQGGRDMSFDGNTTKEIWVNTGDRKIYTSLEDAKTARAADPCK